MNRCQGTVTDYKQLATTLAELQSEVVSGLPRCCWWCAKVRWGFRQNGRILWHKWMCYGISGIHKEHDLIFGCGLKKMGLGVLYAALVTGILWHEPSCGLEIDCISHLNEIDYTSSLDRLRPYLYSSEYLVTTASHNVPSFESKSLTLGLGATAPQHSLLWTRFGCPDARKSWKHRCRHESTCYARLENAQVDWFKLKQRNFKRYSMLEHCVPVFNSRSLPDFFLLPALWR